MSVQRAGKSLELQREQQCGGRGHSKGLDVQVLRKPLFRSEILLSVQHKAIDVSRGRIACSELWPNTDVSVCSPGVFPGALAALGLGHWRWKLRCARLRTHALESKIVGFKFKFYHLLTVRL